VTHQQGVAATARVRAMCIWGALAVSRVQDLVSARTAMARQERVIARRQAVKDRSDPG